MQQEVQLKDNHGEFGFAHSDQSFKDICNEVIRIFEKLELMMNSR